MTRKNAVFYIFLIIAFTGGVECEHGNTELYLKLLRGHNYLVPPSSSNITVSVNLELLNILHVDLRNQEMTFSGILNLHWNDSTLSWNRTEFSLVNRVTLPCDKIWTPDILIWNSASDSNNIHRAGGDLFISPSGQIHWPIFGYFKTACTIDITYYPFDQQTCVIKIGTTDFTIQINHVKDSIDFNQFYMSVFWKVIEAPAYRNVYRTQNDEFPAETDVTYYFTIKRNTHWLSEVCPLLVFAFVTIIPTAVTRSLEKLILQVFCMAGLFALHKDIMNKLPPTSFVNPLVSKYIMALILYNLIHLTFTTIMNNCPKEYFDWIAQKISIQRLRERISSVTERNNDEEEMRVKQDIDIEENEENLLNRTARQTGNGGDKIVVICNRTILVLLILAVTISTLCFLFGHPD